MQSFVAWTKELWAEETCTGAAFARSGALQAWNQTLKLAPRTVPEPKRHREEGQVREKEHGGFGTVLVLGARVNWSRVGTCATESFIVLLWFLRGRTCSSPFFSKVGRVFASLRRSRPEVMSGLWSQVLRLVLDGPSGRQDDDFGSSNLRKCRDREGGKEGT